MYSNLDEIIDDVEFRYGIEKINSWYDKESKSLSIVTIPYNSTLIFCDIILKLIEEHRQVLYVWNGSGIKERIMMHLNRNNSDIKYNYITQGQSKDDIVFVNYKNIDHISGNYDLVIYDDISYYSSLNNKQVNNIYKKLLNRFAKVILYSIEETDSQEGFYLGPLSTEKPFVEPRIINTRIDLNKDIPSILYDYLQWFRSEKKKVLLLVPQKENIQCVYEYYVNKLKMNGVKILKGYKSNYENLKYEVLQNRNQSIFIITNDMEVVLKDFTVDEAVLLFSDNMLFSYKRIIYICAYIGKRNKQMPEVLMVSKNVSLDMDTAKNISRNFNKIIWDKKLKLF